MAKTQTNPAGSWLTAKAMANELGVDWGWVIRRLPQLSSPGEPRKHPRAGVFTHYPPECLEELRIIREEEKSYPPYGDYLAMAQLAKGCKRSLVWVTNRLSQMGVTPEKRIDPVGKVGDYYPPEVLSKLQAMAKEHPESGDWLTINQLARMADVDREWVKSRIAARGIPPETRRIPGSGKLADHWPPELGEDLKLEAEAIPLAGSWLTAHAMEQLLDRSFNWVRRHLAPYAHLSQWRRDQHGVPRLHYSPTVFNRLFAAREAKVPMKPLWRIMLRLREEHGFQWTDLRRLAGIRTRLEWLGRNKFILRHEALDLVFSLRELVSGVDSELEGYYKHLRKTKAPMMPRASKPVAVKQAISGIQGHVLKLAQLDDWYFAICETCTWSSNVGHPNRGLAEKAFIDHAHGRHEAKLEDEGLLNPER